MADLLKAKCLPALAMMAIRFYGSPQNLIFTRLPWATMDLKTKRLGGLSTCVVLRAQRYTIWPGLQMAHFSLLGAWTMLPEFTMLTPVMISSPFNIATLHHLTLVRTNGSTDSRAQSLCSGGGLGSLERIRCHPILGSICSHL